jgi:tetratricopeptide (TPR) repeat protein
VSLSQSKKITQLTTKLLMRYFLTIFFTLIFFQIYSQTNLQNSWIKIKVERKDSSKVIDRLGLEKAYLEYSFSKKNVEIYTSLGQKNEMSYVLNGNTLKIGDFVNFTIENLNDTSLILLEIPAQQLTEDKYNRYYFIKKRYYNNYIFKNKLVEFENDTTIIASNYLSPIYEDGDFSQLILKKVSTLREEIVMGSFMISPDNEVSNITIYDRDRYDEKINVKFTKAIELSTGKWKIPVTPNKYYYKINFTCRISNEALLVCFLFFTLDKKRFTNTGLTLNQIQEVQNYYSKGIQYTSNKDFNKAIDEFTKCIKIDTTFFDAYYNRAASYYNIKKYEKACGDWKYLIDLGQKYAEKLYFENCKNMKND